MQRSRPPHAHTQACTHVLRHMFTFAHMHTCIQTHVRICTHAHMCVHACIHMYFHQILRIYRHGDRSGLVCPFLCITDCNLAGSAFMSSPYAEI